MPNLTFSTQTTKAGFPAGAVFAPVAGNPNQIAGYIIDPATGMKKSFTATMKPVGSFIGEQARAAAAGPSYTISWK